MLISNAKVNPAYRTYSKGNPFQVIFFRFNPVFFTENVAMGDACQGYFC